MFGLTPGNVTSVRAINVRTGKLVGKSHAHAAGRGDTLCGQNLTRTACHHRRIESAKDVTCEACAEAIASMFPTKPVELTPAAEVPTS